MKTFQIFKRRFELITGLLFIDFVLPIVLGAHHFTVSFLLLPGLSTLSHLQKDTRTSRIYSSLTRPVARIAAVRELNFRIRNSLLCIIMTLFLSVFRSPSFQSASHSHPIPPSLSLFLSLSRRQLARNLGLTPMSFWCNHSP